MFPSQPVRAGADKYRTQMLWMFFVRCEGVFESISRETVHGLQIRQSWSLIFNASQNMTVPHRRIRVRYTTITRQSFYI